MDTEDSYTFTVECGAVVLPQGTQDAARTVTSTQEDNDIWVWITICCIILFIISMVVMVVVYVRHKRAEETGNNVSMEIALNDPAVPARSGENFVSDQYLQYKTPTADGGVFTVPHVTAGLSVGMKTPSEDKPIDFPVEPDVMDGTVGGGDGNPTTTGLDDLEWDDDKIFSV